MKRFGRELASLCTVLAISAAIVSVFPYGAIGFKARPPSAPTPAAAFITLSPDEEAAAMRAAKTSWKGDADSCLRVRADLSFGELPTTREESVLGVGERSRPPRFRDVGWTPPPFLPSQAASPLRPIPPGDAPKEAPAFSREELLSLDQLERKEQPR